LSYLVGVDGGGTTTKAVVTDSSGRVLGRARAAGCNPLVVGFDVATGRVVEAVERALQAAGVAARDLRALCAGIAGAGRQREREEIRSRLARKFCGAEIFVEHDAAIALAGATCLKAGVVVIAGTGSIAYGRNEDGETARAGGWGRIAGDEGSAYWLGKRLLQGVFRAYDGRSPSTVAVRLLLERLRFGSVEELASYLWLFEREPERVAALAPIVGEAARLGDAFARELLEEAGRLLAELASAVIRTLHMQNARFEVAYCGGVFAQRGFLLNAFTDYVLRTAKAVSIIEPRLPAVFGAVLLAAERVGVRVEGFVKELQRASEGGAQRWAKNGGFHV